MTPDELRICNVVDTLIRKNRSFALWRIPGESPRFAMQTSGSIAESILLLRMALITAIGDSVNRMIPPLIVTKKQIDELMLIMRASIEDAAAKYESK